MLESEMRLDWRGRDVQRGTHRSVRLGMADNLDRCVETVKPRTPVLTGELQGSMARGPVMEVRPGVFEGSFGSWGVDHAIPVELGSVRRAPVYMITSTAGDVFPMLKNDIQERMG